MLQAIDHRRTGYINAKSLVEVMVTLGEAISEGDAAEMVGKAGKSGKISYEGKSAGMDRGGGTVLHYVSCFQSSLR